MITDRDDTTIYPTHSCFDDVATYLRELAERGATLKTLEQYTVVHAICLLESDGGRPYAHAWLEREDDGVVEVIFGGILRGERVFIHARRDEYREKAFVWDEMRYTIHQCTAEEMRTGWLGGPWVLEYRALCSDVRKKMSTAQ
jgi:hypothetical protein